MQLPRNTSCQAVKIQLVPALGMQDITISIVEALIEQNMSCIATWVRTPMRHVFQVKSSHTVPITSLCLHTYRSSHSLDFYLF